MDEKRARAILREGAEAYSSRMMNSFSDWVNKRSCVNGDRDFVSYYFKAVSSENSRGANQRLYDISSSLQNKIFDDYFSSV